MSTQALLNTHTCKGITGVVNAAFVGQVKGTLDNTWKPHVDSATHTTYILNNLTHPHRQTRILLKEKNLAVIILAKGGAVH